MKVAANDIAELHALSGHEHHKRPHVISHATVYPDPRAVFAMDLMKNLAVAMAEPDGFDEAGRQKLKPMDQLAIAQRACGIASEAFALFDEYGWLLRMPGFDELTPHDEAQD